MVAREDSALLRRSRPRSHAQTADPYRPQVVACTGAGVVLVLSAALAYVRYCPCFNMATAPTIGDVLVGAGSPQQLPGHQGNSSYFSSSEVVGDGQVRRLRFFSTARPQDQLKWGDVIKLWRTDHAFRLSFNRALAASPPPAFFWETPPLTDSQRDTIPFECVTIPSAHLKSISADPGPFSSFIGPCRGSGGAVAFDNLGGDAHLVAPCEDAKAVAMRKSAPDGLDMYAHIAAFVRAASDDQASAFWSTVGSAIDETLRVRGASPTWVSTEGSGVSWLHVRLDTRPKYYHYGPYKPPPAGSG